MKRLFILFAIMGMVYFTLEGLWRGSANIIMLVIGGLCGVIVGLLNEHEFFRQRLRLQCLVGWFAVLSIELVAGLILNVWLGLNIWDYSYIKFNLYGQICLPYALLWLLIMPFVIWFDDYLRFKLFDEEDEFYSLWEIYRKILY